MTGQKTPIIKVADSELSEAHSGELFDCRVEHSVHVASRMVARFHDAHFALLDADVAKIGDAIEVQFHDHDNQPQKTFVGEVSSIATDFGRDDQNELIITALDKGHRLTHGTQMRSFLDQSYADVVNKIAGEHGLGKKVSNAGGAGTVHPYLFQTTTDYAYLSQMAQAVGFEWWIDLDEKLNFEPRRMDAPTTLTYGGNLDFIRARYSAAERADEIMVRSVDPNSHQLIEGKDKTVAKQNTMVAGTDAKIAKRLNDQANKAKKWGGKLITGSTAVGSSSEANALAKAFGERIAAAEFRARGEADITPKLKGGSVIELDNVGQSLKGKYYLTAVEHIWGTGRNPTTRFEIGGYERDTFVDLLGSAQAPHPHVGDLGLVVGTVTNVEDPENMSRVKVKFPWLSDKDESWWAKVISPGAGKDAGMQVIPSVNDEVVVGFERGDLRRPLVLGGVWTSKNKAPWPHTDFSNKGENKAWSFKTPKGHTFIAHDDKGSGKGKNSFAWQLQDKDTKFHLGDDKVTLETRGRLIEIKNDKGSISLDKTGKIIIEGTEIVITSTKGDIEISSKMNLKAESKVALDLKAGANAKMDSKAGTDVKSSAIVTVKGAMVKIN